MGEHAYFSPSASGRWLECPVSLHLYDKLAKQSTSSVQAHEGTVCHEVAADCLTKKTPVSDYAGKIIENVTMSPELIDAMQMYVDEVQGLTKEFDAIGGRIEQKVELTKDCWGTADAMIWNADTLVVIDLKMGKGVVVPIEDNTQLKIYGIGGAKWLWENEKIKIKKVVTYIIQPRTPNPIRRAEYTMQELSDFVNTKLIPVFRLHEKKELASLACNPGEKQCQWCEIKACKAKANKAVNDAAKAFAPFTEIEKPGIAEDDKKELSTADLAVLKVNFKFIQDWIKSIDTLLLDTALMGHDVTGYKLVEGRANRKWSDVPEKTIADFLSGLGTEPYEKKLLSPAKAEKALGKKVAKDSALSTFIVKPKGAPNLVPMSDKRQAIKIGVEKVEEEKVEKEKVEKEKADVIADSIGDEFAEFAESSNDTILVGDECEPEPEVDENNRERPLSVMERMRLMDIEEEEVYEEEEKKNEVSITTQEIATGGNPVADDGVHLVEKVISTSPTTQPRSGIKRREVFILGQEKGNTISIAAKVLNCSENMVKMHLRYLNERDNCSYEIYSDGTFRVY